MKDPKAPQQQAAHQAELEVAAACLFLAEREPTLIPGLASRCKPADFVHLRSKAIYSAALRLHRAGTVINVVTIGADMESVGWRENALLDALHELAGVSSYVVEVVYASAQVVRNAALQRREQELLSRLPKLAQEGAARRAITAELAEVQREQEEGASGVELPVTMGDQVREEELQWLWHGRVPFGALTLLVGDPGKGKSLLSCYLASAVTTGSPLSQDHRPRSVGNVLMIAHEDPRAAVVQRRLTSAGTDMRRLIYSDLVVSLPSDVAALERTVRKHHVTLLILDPLAAYLDSRLSANKDQDVRRALAPLGQMAEATGCAVLVVHHMNKGGGAAGPGPAIYRAGGSIGIVGIARMAHLLAPDPDAPKQRIIAPLKANVVKDLPSLKFHVSEDERGVPYLVPTGESTLTADSLLSQPNGRASKAVEEACGVLKAILADGKLRQAEVEEQALAVGVKPRTLARAKKKLGVLSTRQVVEGKACWAWELPLAPPPTPTTTH